MVPMRIYFRGPNRNQRTGTFIYRNAGSICRAAGKRGDKNLFFHAGANSRTKNSSKSIGSSNEQGGSAYNPYWRRLWWQGGPGHYLGSDVRTGIISFKETRKIFIAPHGRYADDRQASSLFI